MALTAKQILEGLGIPAESYAGKDLGAWDSKISEEGTTALAAAQKKLDDATALQNVINDNITSFGINETNMAQLRASNAALTAALEEVKKAGFSGITIPDLPTSHTPTLSPEDQYRNNVAQGFAQMGQAMNAINRYYRVMGKPLPEDPTALADNASRMRMSVNDYVEHTYKLTQEENSAREKAETAAREAYAQTKLDEYKAANPNNAGHPELNGGLPSNNPYMPKPRDGKDVREFASMSARDKIASAMGRASQAATSRTGS